MKTIFSNLLFDRKLVDQLKENKLNSELLYVQLMSGKITLKEYMAAL
jgi:hypothetical protein